MLVENDLFSGTRDKVAIAIERLRNFEPVDGSGYYVAFSGGKDSIVVKDLVIKSGVKYDIHFNVTTVDPPELLNFIRKHHPDVQRHIPQESMFKLIMRKMMPPTRIVRYCCEALKEGGGKDRVVITGVRWAESANRSKRKMFEASRRNGRRFFLHPIIDWSDAEVWQYIRDNKLPYCSLYDEGWKRIGCIGCPMAGKNRAKEFKRWPKYEVAYRRVFERIAITGTEANKKLHWKTGDDVFNWWMDKNRQPNAPAQCMLFE